MEKPADNPPERTKTAGDYFVECHGLAWIGTGASRPVWRLIVDSWIEHPRSFSHSFCEESGHLRGYPDIPTTTTNTTRSSSIHEMSVYEV